MALTDLERKLLAALKGLVREMAGCEDCDAPDDVQAVIAEAEALDTVPVDDTFEPPQPDDGFRL